ncbi:MAG: 4-hydroxy-3-methylbut-2-enyl diphosphate reductase [Elusimicrobia bacterium]|nr:4-hydroxy-3-methylbut-2-enyl diphosphate reductase [Elusimicrobiota bacterium]
MPNITIAKNAGFCPGVKRAIDQVLELSKKTGKKIYTLGPLIHNKEVIKNLEENNIFAVNDADDIKEENAILVIRAHGIPPNLEEKIRSKKLEIVDGTCALVKSVHRNISSYKEKGYHTVIVGDKDHAEVIGLKGYAGEKSFVISSPKEAKTLPEMDKVNIVSQTTQEEEVFLECAKILRTKTKELIVSNTICNPTRLRQKETIEMSSKSDLVIVVGGKHSANTVRLYEICSRISPKALLIEKPEDLDEKDLKNAKEIFITAGASAPNWLIEAVAAKVKKEIMPGKKYAQAWDFFLNSGLYTGAAAAFFTLASARLLGVYGLPKKLIFASAAFVLSLHVLNRAVSKDNKISSANYAAAKIAAYLSAGICFFLTLLTDIKIFAACIFLWSAGALYSYSFAFMARKFQGIKEAAMALGWTFACAVMPIMNFKSSFRKEELFFCLSVFFISWSRSVLLSIAQSKNDMLVGKESLYKIIGEKYIYFTLYLFTVLSAGALYFSGPPKKTFLSIILFFLYQAALTAYFSKGKIPDKLNSEALIDLSFIILGVFAAG